MKRNAEAVGIKLTDEIRIEMDKITEPIKAKLGPNADPWRTVSRME